MHTSVSRRGRYALISFAARAGAKANHAQTFQPDHEIGADHRYNFDFLCRTNSAGRDRFSLFAESP
jgi:hypothetical protein